jgi:hypothetical protein
MRVATHEAEVRARARPRTTRDARGRTHRFRYLTSLLSEVSLSQRVRRPERELVTYYNLVYAYAEEREPRK